MRRSLILFLSMAFISAFPSCGRLLDLFKVEKYSLVLKVAEEDRGKLIELESALKKRLDVGGVRSSFTRRDLPGSKGILLAGELR